MVQWWVHVDSGPKQQGSLWWLIWPGDSWLNQNPLIYSVNFTTIPLSQRNGRIIQCMWRAPSLRKIFAFIEERTLMCKLPQMDHSCPFIEANSIGSLCLVRTSNQDVLGILVLVLGSYQTWAPNCQNNATVVPYPS